MDLKTPLLTKSSRIQTPWNSIICPGTAARKHTWLRFKSLPKSVDLTGFLLFWLENSSALPLWLVPVTSATIGAFLAGGCCCCRFGQLNVGFHSPTATTVDSGALAHVFPLNRLFVYSPSIFGLGVPVTALTVFSCDLEPAVKEHNYACKD